MPATLALPMLVRCAECQLGLRAFPRVNLTNVHVAQQVHDLTFD
jgi:hypothetical protein